MDFIKGLIARMISGAIFTAIGIVIRTCWIVFSSGFTTSFTETFKEVRAEGDSYTNRILGYTVFIIITLTLIVSI